MYYYTPHMFYIWGVYRRAHFLTQISTSKSLLPKAKTSLYMPDSRAVLPTPSPPTPYQLLTIAKSPKSLGLNLPRARCIKSPQRRPHALS